jgi:hypothetical protein
LVFAIGCVMAIAAADALVAQPRAPVSLPTDLGTRDDALGRLFTPATFPAGTFVVYRTAEHIGKLASRLKALDPEPVQGAWDVGRSGVFDALGAEGPYDKGRVARLFGGSSPSAARGSLQTADGRMAITLVSPYPDPSLASLRTGTMVIVTRLPGARAVDVRP